MEKLGVGERALLIPYLEGKAFAERLAGFVEQIEEIVKRYAPAAEVFVFGSFVEGTWTPSSDIDLLIVTQGLSLEERRQMRGELIKAFGLSSPLEFHIIADDDLLKLYRRRARLLPMRSLLTPTEASS